MADVYQGKVQVCFPQDGGSVENGRHKRHDELLQAVNHFRRVENCELVVIEPSGSGEIVYEWRCDMIGSPLEQSDIPPDFLSKFGKCCVWSGLAVWETNEVWLGEADE